MKVLFLSNLFPDASEPNRGSYNAQLLKHLSKHCEIRVLSPRSTRGFPPFWFPRKRISREQDAMFIPVYPPVAYVPKIGSRINHLLMALFVEASLKSIREEFPFDVVLSSWIYPDACATAELARRNNFPFVAIAQGSDVHQYLKIPTRRKIIAGSLNRASAIVTRSQELKRQLIDVGVQKDKTHTIYNGVSFNIFYPSDKIAARKQIGVSDDSFIFLFVGNLLPIKNPLLLVESHAAFCRKHPAKKSRLLMIGTGPLQSAIKERARILGTENLVSLVGAKSPQEVARYMQAADLLCVPSDNEGLPNVILEAFACGLRVVARKVGGIPEVVSDDYLGELVDENDPQTMASAMARALAHSVQSEKIQTYARQFSWEATAQRYFTLLDAARRKQ